MPTQEAFNQRLCFTRLGNGEPNGFGIEVVCTIKKIFCNYNVISKSMLFERFVQVHIKQTHLHHGIHGPAQAYPIYWQRRTESESYQHDSIQTMFFIQRCAWFKIFDSKCLTPHVWFQTLDSKWLTPNVWFEMFDSNYLIAWFQIWFHMKCLFRHVRFQMIWLFQNIWFQILNSNCYIQSELQEVLEDLMHFTCNCCPSSRTFWDCFLDTIFQRCHGIFKRSQIIGGLEFKA